MGKSDRLLCEQVRSFRHTGVGRIIDEIGGVYIDIPRNMNYEDPTQDLYIHLKRDTAFRWKTAVNLARFRNYPEGDIDGLLRQKLLIELAKKALKPRMY